MLTKIILQNFKCFERLDLACKPLTLLCGLNGMGKSSVIQGLLLLRQSYQSNIWGKDNSYLILGGELSDLGTSKDVLYEGADEEYLEFELHSSVSSDSCKLHFCYLSPEDDQLVLESSDKSRVSDDWGSVPPFGGRVAYVSADRVGPQKLYLWSSTSARVGELGTRCELTMNYLKAHGRELTPKSDARCIQEQRQLHSIVEYWLQKVSPGCRLEIREIAGADALVSGFKYEQPGDVTTQVYRTINVGFGLSYVLPVIVSLMLPVGTLCLIENPEAHLHPRGQTKLAELAVRAASAGVQVMVETHSDHFLDGVRIAVRNGLIEPDNIAINFFERESGKSFITSPEIDSDGRLTSWPKGFFDQQSLNLLRLLESKS